MRQMHWLSLLSVVSCTIKENNMKTHTSDKKGNWELALIFGVFYLLFTWLLPFGFAFVGLFLIAIAIVLLKEKTISKILLLLSPILIVPFLTYLLGMILISLRIPMFRSYVTLIIPPLAIGIVCALLIRDYLVSWVRSADRWIGVIIAAVMIVASWIGAHVAQLCNNVSYYEKGITEHEIAFCKFMHQYQPTSSSKFMGWPEAAFFTLILPVTAVFLILLGNMLWKLRKKALK